MGAWCGRERECVGVGGCVGVRLWVCACAVVGVCAGVRARGPVCVGLGAAFFV